MAKGKKKSSKKSAAKCAGIGAKGRLKKGYRHRKGGLKKGCPVPAKRK